MLHKNEQRSEQPAQIFLLSPFQQTTEIKKKLSLLSLNFYLKRKQNDKFRNSFAFKKMGTFAGVIFLFFNFFIFKGHWEHNLTGQITLEWRGAACFCSTSGAQTSKGLDRSITINKLWAGYWLLTNNQFPDSFQWLWVWLFTSEFDHCGLCAPGLRLAILEPRCYKSTCCDCQLIGVHIQQRAMTKKIQCTQTILLEYKH